MKIVKGTRVGVLIVFIILLLIESVIADGSVFPMTFPVTFGEGNGNGECTTPVISSLTNSTPGTTSVTITWTTNQSANNRVKYSKNSDLSNPLWSSWANDTSSVSIELTGLDMNTTYYYQAWSYNGTNSSCYATEPSSQPYRSFTTANPNQGSWTKIVPIHINNIGGGAQAYYPVRLLVPYDSDMNIDFSDIRVVENETYGFIPYWIENKSDGEWCMLWFNATYIPANSWCNDTYYLLYGNPLASDASNGDATFIFFDDFEDGDVSDWTIQSGGAFEASTAQVKSGSYSGREYSSTDDAVSFHSFGNQLNDIMIELDYRPTKVSDHHNRINIGTDGSNDILLVAGSSDATFRYFNPNRVDMRNFDTQWYKIQVLAKPSQNKASVWIDGTLEIDNDGVFGDISGGVNSIGFSQYYEDSEEFVDNIFIRKYASPEPSAQLGAEQNIGNETSCTNPVISSLSSSDITTNSAVIKWSTNQSTDNRVKYSKYSDLSNPIWSNWMNDTTSISITLTGLEANTTYYYQAWSYNGTNSSCYTVEPSGQPYNSFTTQSSPYTITLAQGYNMIGWTSTTPTTSSELCSIVPNCTYVYKKNPDGSWITKHCGYPGGGFNVSRGFSFLAYITEEYDWTRDE